MNEQINQLWTRVCQDEMPELDVTCMTPQRQKKFSELIVKECTGVLYKRFMGDLNREDMEVRRCISDLKQHFGVEE